MDRIRREKCSCRTESLPRKPLDRMRAIELFSLVGWKKEKEKETKKKKYTNKLASNHESDGLNKVEYIWRDSPVVVLKPHGNTMR